jgi:hypothetical protein
MKAILHFTCMVNHGKSAERKKKEVEVRIDLSSFVVGEGPNEHDSVQQLKPN